MIDINQVLRRLGKTRPIFHSEADFQHALAWEIHSRLRDCSVRLEFPFQKENRGLHLDIWIEGASGVLAIELKYKTRKMNVESNGERFRLKDQSAQDIGRYEFLKDVERLEHVVTYNQNCAAYAIMLTNDSAYWKSPRDDRTTYENFRLEESRVLHGTLSWGEHTGTGTMKGREHPIILTGRYIVKWSDYSRLDAPSYDAFRSLVIRIEPQTGVISRLKENASTI